MTPASHHADDTPTESMIDSTRIILPGPLADPVPRVMTRKADDLAFVSPELLREKLRAVGYREPILPVPSQCAVDNCPNVTHDVICFDCASEIEWMAREEEDRKSRAKAAKAFWPAFLMICALLAGLFYCATELGVWLREVVK
jgi:hypothetical protein